MSASHRRDRRRLDLHAGAGLGALARARPDRDRRARAARHRRRAPRGGRRAWRGGCSSGRASTGRLEVTGELDRALDGADVVLIQIRVGGQEARAAPTRRSRCACGCIGQETTGAGGFAKAMRTVPVVLEIAERARELAAAGRLDRRLHQPGRDRHAGAARRRPSRGRALQRRDRLPARDARQLLGVEPSRLLVDQVGLNHLTWVRAVCLDGEDVLADAARRARRAGRRAQSALPAGAAHGARRGALATTCTTSTEDERARRAARPGRRGRRWSPRSSASCSSSTATRRWPRSRRCSSSAAAPSTARRRHGAGRLAVRRLGRRPGGRRPQRRHARRPGDGRRGRGPGADRARRRRSRSHQAPLAPELLGLVQHVAAYERLTAEAAVRGDRGPREGAARPPADRPVGALGRAARPARGGRGIARAPAGAEAVR